MSSATQRVARDTGLERSLTPNAHYSNAINVKIFFCFGFIAQEEKVLRQLIV